MNDESLVQPKQVKEPYEKPLLQEEEEMLFPEEVWKQFSDGKWCFGCTNCNCN